MIKQFCSREHFPLSVFFFLSGTPGLLWAYEELGLLFAIELAIPGLLIALGVQRLVEKGWPIAYPEAVPEIIAPVELAQSARLMLEAAVEIARERGHRYVGTEHLLFAAAGRQSGVEARMLDDMGIESNQVLSALDFILGQGMTPTAEQPALTPRAVNVLEIASSIARERQRLAVEVDDVLAAILREGQGASAGILRGLGAQLPDLRQAT